MSTILDYIIIYYSAGSIILLNTIKLIYFDVLPRQEKGGTDTPLRKLSIDIRAEDAKFRGGVDIRQI